MERALSSGAGGAGTLTSRWKRRGGGGGGKAFSIG